MTILRTLGTGGNYSDLTPALTWLTSQGGFTEDVEFRAITAFTISSHESGTIGPLNGFTFKFTSSIPHDNNPNGGNIITTSDRIEININNTTGGTVLIEGLNIKSTYHPGAASSLFNIFTFGNPTANMYYIYNKIIAENQESTPLRVKFFATGFNNTYSNYRILNSKLYGFEEFCQLPLTTNTNIVVENTVLDNMYSGINLDTILTMQLNIIFRNSVSIRTGFTDDWIIGSNLQTLTIENCADNDNSLTYGSNNQNGISYLKNFQSVDINSSYYLRFIFGTERNGVYSEGATELGTSGIAPSYAGVTDIAGNSRPDASGRYSIGAESQEYISITTLQTHTTNQDISMPNTINNYNKQKKKDIVKIIITDRNNEIFSDDNQFTQYSFDSQYGSVSSVFNVTLTNPKKKIEVGFGIQLLINGIIAYRGIIELKSHVISKDTNQVILSGKDRSSILVEGYLNSYKDFNNEYPKDIIDNLINQTNFYVKSKGSITSTVDATGFNDSDDIISRNSAILDDVNNSDTLNERNDVTTYDSEFENLSIIPNYKISMGDTAYNKISQLVKSRGYEILYQPNGTLYIGDLQKKRTADKIIYEITNRQNGESNNVLSASKNEDISGRYSTVSIAAQAESYRWSASKTSVNEEAIAIDSTMPYKKYYAEQINDTEGSAENYAIRTREDQRIAGYEIMYEVYGHTADNGELWDINRYVNVFDEMYEVYKSFVIYGRMFVFDADTGTRTILRISHERIKKLSI